MPKTKPKYGICPICEEEPISRKDRKTCGVKCGREMESRTKAHEAASDKESIEVSKDKMTVSLPKTTIHTLDELIEYCKVDLRIWEVDRFLVNKWEMGYKDESGQGHARELYQVKAWLKKKLVVDAALREIESLKEDANRIKIPRLNIVKPSRFKKPGENMLEVSINDHHFGKLAWAPETGWADYDTKIARELFDDCTRSIISRCPERIDKIVFVVGNDLMHVDNMDNVTTAGTPQDVDSRYHKVFRITREAVRQSVERLVQVAPVHILTVPGNHDTLASWHIGDSLGCLYEGHKWITVDAEPNHKKFTEWGDVLLMHVHGDRVKKRAETLIRIMSVESQAWSGARWREIHCGHFHHLEAYEENGVRMRVLPSLCATDYYHAKHGYSGTQRASESYLWSKSDGLLSMINYNVPKRFERRDES